ncbi:bactericidal permeability-increasing protein [Gadus morhua]|uniref:Bactericidal permeability-increasing protein n=1 Tax=Gadus morhua TaxID=8049 RepID=A0A8C4Z0Y3_GADMO|nr:bactericidal permeability-increasing protein-like [Gadus morhua]
MRPRRLGNCQSRKFPRPATHEIMTGRMLLYLTAGCLLTCLAHGTQPAIKVILSEKGLQYVKEMGAEWLLQNLGSASPPDVHGKLSLSLGTVYYSIMGMAVTYCEFAEPSVEFYEDVTGFKAVISGLYIQVKGAWSASYGIFEDGGAFELVIRDLEVDLLLGLGMDADGQPSFRCAACGASVGSAGLNLIDASWIIEQFIDEELIRSTIEEKICPMITERLDELEYRLAALGATFQVNHLLAVDLPLTSYPVVNSSCLSLSLKGMFHRPDSPVDPPFEPQPFSLDGQPGYMLSLGLSEYTTNSASHAYFVSGSLQLLITDSMIPPSSPLHLNTNSFGPFVPKLPKMFPDMEMQLQVFALEAPEFMFRSGVVRMDVHGAIKAFVVRPDGTFIFLFRLNLESTFSGKFRMANEKLTGAIALENLYLTLDSSEVGEVQTDALKIAIKFGIKLSGLPRLNAKLAKGIDLPTMQHAHLTNLVLEVEEGFISVLSDAEIKLREAKVGTPWMV